MAGVYIHIPFCKQACYYCNFHFSTSLQLKNDFVGALLKEMEIQREYLLGEAVETIYFGGGTPSLLSEAELDAILGSLRRIFPLSAQPEITLEANPDDMNPVALAVWKKQGINRLSIGIQSFFDQDLTWMNRAHSSAQGTAAILGARQAGFENISIDLIYGTPGLSDLHWKKNVDQLLEWGIPHLSCYALTVEPKTALDHMIHTHRKSDVDPDAQATQFTLLMDWLAKAGYEHYEISNFALPGKRSRHNSSYWKGVKYLGLGPSAHSFDGHARQWNLSNNALYIKALQGGQVPFEKEELTGLQLLNEYIMTSLRTLEGCSLELVAARFGAARSQTLFKGSQIYLDRKQMDCQDGNLVLTKEGKLLADGIAAALFFEQ